MNTSFKNDLLCQTSFFKIDEMVDIKGYDKETIDSYIKEIKGSLKVEKKMTDKQIFDLALKDKDRNNILIGIYK